MRWFWSVRIGWPIGVWVWGWAWFLMVLSVQAEGVDFTQEIRPLLSRNCFFCHGPDAGKRKASLRLDVESEAKRDLGGYFAILPGNPDSSVLLERMTSQDPDERMPPAHSGKVMSEEEIALVRQWILQGAPYERHWAYEPGLKTAVPQLEASGWVEQPLDRFILKGVIQRQGTPGPEADKRTLLRRLFLDLTGLPPGPEEVEAFLESSSPAAYEEWIDRILHSEKFGEQMASMWLDWVRYADTVGYHGDQDHNISPYRDYVIEAFNANKPFTTFTREQLAGDLIPESGDEGLIASGYNRLLQTSHEGGVQEKEYLAIYAADRVRNISAVWMGATLGCAQCHDHKFDPFTTADFYRMSAFFADLDEAQHFKVGDNSLPTRRPPEKPLLTVGEHRVLQSMKEDLNDLATRQPHGNSLDHEMTSLKKQMSLLEKSARTTMISASIEPRTIRILPRGNWLDESGEVVLPDVPEFLGGLHVEGRRATRLDLANWLLDENHGIGALTARVLVNRLWAHFFGQGISRNLLDFGAQGEPPTHPELLDYLAADLISSGWDLKRFIRQVVTSQTYRLSSIPSEWADKNDPQNKWLSHQNRFRLSAEALRDSALFLSGLLTYQTGGGSARPYQPEGYYRHLNFPTREYHADHNAQQWRRGVYVHWQRQFLHPMLKAFDAPTREECTVSRPRSNTPTAALTLLNDPTFVEAARQFANQVQSFGGQSVESRVSFAVEWVLSRPPDEYETSFLQDFYQQQFQYYQLNPELARELISVGISSSEREGDVIEQAAWTAVARTLFNLHEAITRN